MVAASLDPVLEELEGCWIESGAELEVEGSVKHWATLETLLQLEVLASCAFAAAGLESLHHQHLLTPFQSLLLPPLFL